LPTEEEKLKQWGHKQFITAIYNEFMTWAGSKTIAIPYDIEKKELFEILD
jgi:hypothetical protein